MTMWEKKPSEINARAAANQLIETFSISTPQEIVIEDIAMARGVLVVEGELHGAEARLLRKGGEGILRVNSSIPEVGRKRFAIAHDLGHWEMHKDISQADLYTGAQEYLYGSSNPQEVEANFFAAELLMPTKLYRPKCAEVYPTFERIKLLAQEFNTTLTSAAVRFIADTEKSCAVVFSINGVVSWWKRSDGCKDIWIEKKQQIGSSTLAWRCHHNQSVPEKGDRVEVSSWLRNSYYGENDKVVEQSMRLGNYSVVLSLIWVD